MMKRFAMTLVGFYCGAAALAAQDIDLEKYEKCVGFALSEGPPPAEAVEACIVPARQGLPGAQYALANILAARSKSGPTPDAINWLEKAAKAGHPPAAFALANVYANSEQKDAQERGSELLRLAICSGYPPAEKELAEIGLDKARIDCSKFGPFKFDGTWSAALKWTQQSQASNSNSSPELRVTISNQQAKVYMRSGQDWMEVKPGKFEFRQADDSLILSALDSGWDFDGKWVESWTLHLFRVSDQEATLHFMRTVNNLHLPASSPLKVFTGVAEGNASHSGS
jgi:hypothetical protein